MTLTFTPSLSVAYLEFSRQDLKCRLFLGFQRFRIRRVSSCQRRNGWHFLTRWSAFSNSGTTVFRTARRGLSLATEVLLFLTTLRKVNDDDDNNGRLRLFATSTLLETDAIFLTLSFHVDPWDARGSFGFFSQGSQARRTFVLSPPPALRTEGLDLGLLALFGAVRRHCFLKGTLGHGY